MLAHDVFGEPDPAARVDVDADTDMMQRGTGQVNIMPAGWPLVNHTFLHGVDVGPGWIGWSGQPDAFAAVGEGETLIGDARTLVQAVGAGMAKSAVIHIPTVQTRSTSQHRIPDEWVESAHGAVMVDLIK